MKEKIRALLNDPKRAKVSKALDTVVEYMDSTGADIEITSDSLDCWINLCD